MLGHAFVIRSLTDIGCHEEIVEDAPTLEGNARLKATHVVERYGLDCFADDTGLEVEALNGEPGVFSARYAGTHADAEANMAKLMAAMDLAGAYDPASRRAQFRTAICLIQGGEERLIEGVCEGHIAVHRSGEEGFGYDPIFIPDGESRTFAGMAADEKNAISHRGKAVRTMVDHLIQ